VTAPDHPRESAARAGDHDGAATARSAGQRAAAARSAKCPCRAPAGAPCRPDGDHLARYLNAWRAGTLSRESLKHAIDGLDVIAPQAIILAAGPAGRHQAGADPGTGRVGSPVTAEPELEPG
jgi:hypothetical protein